MRAYRLLLRAYPKSFRDEYGADMEAIFTRRLACAGRLSPIGIWASAIADIVVNAALVHADIARQDLRHVARTLKQAPAFSATAVAVVALGIGATTAVFSIVDFVLLRPLPFPDADRLAKVWEVHPGFPQMEFSPANYRNVKAAATAFESLGAYRGLAVNIVTASEPEHVEGAVVTADVLRALRVPPLVGRLFGGDDERADAPAVVLLSEGLWRSHFEGSAGVLGRTILLDGRPYVVVGVMPRTFFFPYRDAQLWTAMQFAPKEFEDRNDNWLAVIGRLRSGVSLAQARADVVLAANRLRAQFPTANAHTDMTAIGLRDELSVRSRIALLALGGAALCVLLIACANLASLLVARAAGRTRELAVRAALGAGRERLARQLLTESLVLAFAGGGLGVVLASVAVPVLSRLVPSNLPIASTPQIDIRVVAFAFIVTTATGLLFGIAPVARTWRGPVADGLISIARAGGVPRERLRGVLVTAQIVASVTLLVSTGLLLKALWRVQREDPGFRTDGMLTVRTALPMPKYETEAARERFYAAVLGAMRAVPGVSSAAYVGFAPMLGAPNFPVGINGVAPRDRSLADVASFLTVTPGYFATVGIPIREGRDVRDADTRDGPWVAVVSESFARRFWPDQDPIGRRFSFAYADRTVVGVVGNARIRGLERPSEPQVYVPYRQMTDGFMVWHAPKDLVVRSSISIASLTGAIRAAVHDADPQQPLSGLRTLDDLVADQTAARAVQVRVLAAFAVVAFLLAAVGIHGLLSFLVAERVREIGVRIALGATARDIVAMVVGSGVRLGLLGTAVGVVAAYASARSMNALLAGVQPADPATFSAAVAGIAAMVLISTAVPTLRALRINPVTAIRSE